MSKYIPLRGIEYIFKIDFLSIFCHFKEMQSCSKSCCIELICIRIQQKNYEKKLNINKRKRFIYIYLNKHSFWHLECVRVQVIAHCAFKVKKKTGKCK